MPTAAKALAGLSGLLLLAVAYLHSTGTNRLREALSSSNVPEFFEEALPTIWLFFSWHLAVIAIPLLWASLTGPRWFLPASIFCAAVALGDFFWVYSVAGWFPGTVLLLLVAALAAAAAILARGKGRSAT